MRGIAFICLLFSTCAALAQYPARAVRMVVPFPAGVVGYDSTTWAE